MKHFKYWALTQGTTMEPKSIGIYRTDVSVSNELGRVIYGTTAKSTADTFHPHKL